MKQVILTDRRAWSMGIAIYQLLGAMVAFILIYRIAGPDMEAGTIFALIPIVAISFVSLFAGIFFFIKGSEMRFYTLSKLNFCLQIPQLVIPGITFLFYYGPYWSMGFDGDYNFLMRFELLTLQFAFKLGDTDTPFVVLNSVPLIPLIILRWIERNPVTEPALENAFMKDEQNT